MKLYNQDNVSLNDLNPYVNMNRRMTGIQFVNQLTNKSLFVKCDDVIAKQIYHGLTTGIKEEELIDLCNQVDIPNLFYLLMQEGMIE
ncbi:MAG: hypothetical protein LUG12_13760 [Erysipelotrichaceae bacterium]|nr:hypothetical protein [Erysipelotrichaceae bacterium]